MSFELTGKVLRIGEVKTFGESFKKAELILKVEDGKYPQEIRFEFIQDRCDLPSTVTEGQDVTVHFDIRGRENKGSWWNSLNGWRIQANGEQPQPSAEAPAADVPDSFDDSDQIPF